MEQDKKTDDSYPLYYYLAADNVPITHPTTTSYFTYSGRKDYGKAVPSSYEKSKITWESGKGKFESTTTSESINYEGNVRKLSMSNQTRLIGVDAAERRIILNS